jgi:hypothetical protein
VSPHLVGLQPPDELLEGFGPLAECKLLIDRLFGSRYQGDVLFVEDAVPEDDSRRETRLHARTCIDRLSGTARDRTLFVSEVAQREGPALCSRLRARHPAGVLTHEPGGFPHEYALLLTALCGLDALGGDRTAGLGRCRVAIDGEAVRWNEEQTFPLREALKSLEDKDWLEMLQLVREASA